MTPIHAHLIRLNLPPVAQATDHDCGPAALLSVAMHYGKPSTLKQVARWCQTTRKDGTKPAGIVRAARKLGLSAMIETEMTSPELRQYIAGEWPVLLAIRAYQDGHWVVAIGHSKRWLFVHDPMLKHCRGRIAWADLGDRWWDEDGGDRYDRLGVVLWHKNPPNVRRAVEVPG